MSAQPRLNLAGRVMTGLMQAKGVNGQITVDGSTVIIERKGAMGFITQGHKGAKRINASDITAIQFKEPGALTNGYIQFSFQGGSESKGGIFNAGTDENTVLFNKKQAPDFRAILDQIEQLRGRRDQSGSIADELEKLAGLRDRGILTEAEFTARKQRLLEG